MKVKDTYSIDNYLLDYYVARAICNKIPDALSSFSFLLYYY